MKMRAWRVALALVALQLWTAFGGESAAAFFERLAGAWRGAGEVSRRVADMRMHWEPVLDGRFHRLSMENRMTVADGEGDVLTIDWGNESSPERGRCTYRLAGDALEVTDEVRGKDGNFSAFGHTRLTREPQEGTLAFP
jgi:hypothetical protein